MKAYKKIYFMKDDKIYFMEDCLQNIFFSMMNYILLNRYSLNIFFFL